MTTEHELDAECDYIDSVLFNTQEEENKPLFVFSSGDNSQGKQSDILKSSHVSQDPPVELKFKQNVKKFNNDYGLCCGVSQ